MSRSDEPPRCLDCQRANGRRMVPRAFMCWLPICFMVSIRCDGWITGSGATCSNGAQTPHDLVDVLCRRRPPQAEAHRALADLGGDTHGLQHRRELDTPGMTGRPGGGGDAL